MEMDPEIFEKLTSAVQAEEKVKAAKLKDSESKWARLEARYNK
jgi:nitrate/TMAO reductase-like tetraheme cytochrome c subunit